jgi:hypothetical protein
MSDKARAVEKSAALTFLFFAKEKHNGTGGYAQE